MQPPSASELTQRSALTNRYSLQAALVLSLAALATMVGVGNPGDVFLLALGSAAALALRLPKARQSGTSPALLIATLSTVLTALLTRSGGLHSPALVFIPLLPVIAVQIGGVRLGLLTAGLWGLLVIGLCLLPSSAGSPAFVVGQVAPPAPFAASLALLALALGTRQALQGDRARAELLHQLRAQLGVDEHTGLLNRSGLREALFRELSRAARLGSPMQLLSVALKAEHDAHIDGNDPRLQPLARALKAGSRAGQDLVARLDRTRFLLLLSDTSSGDAQQVAQRLAEDTRAILEASTGSAPALSPRIGLSTRSSPLPKVITPAFADAWLDQALLDAAPEAALGANNGNSADGAVDSLRHC
ncbi:MAG: diguanylate cyclase [Pseudomonadota bacterium]